MVDGGWQMANGKWQMVVVFGGCFWWLRLVVAVGGCGRCFSFACSQTNIWQADALSNSKLCFQAPSLRRVHSPTWSFSTCHPDLNVAKRGIRFF
jgi:hypothetical protein